MYPSTTSTERGCGKRVPAGIYAETRLSPGGQPIETFIVDPPKRIDIEAWGLTARGAKLIEVGGIWHIFDIVGREHYPYVADMVEEIRRKGASRRLAGNLDFSRLTPESRLVLVHARAVIDNFNEYPQPPRVVCPRFEHLAHLKEPCAGLWWHDIPENDLTVDAYGNYQRAIPGGVAYHATPRVEGITPHYHHGIFIRLPVTNLAVIAGRNPQEEREAEKSCQAAGQSSLPVYMEAE